MKKTQIFTIMSLLTGAGFLMIAVGLANLSQLPDYSLAQAWNSLWEEHNLFAWVATSYCSIIMICDLWVIAGIITQTAIHKKTI